MNCKIVPFFLCLILNTCQYTEADYYCDNLIQRMSDGEISQKLELWFDSQFKAKHITKSIDYKYGGVFYLGNHTYLQPFDWSILEFDETRSLIKIIEIQEEVVGSETLAKVDSVYIGERGRIGVLVKSDSASNYGIGENPEFINEITDRVMVLCVDLGF